jgi:hypothetical protein
MRIRAFRFRMLFVARRYELQRIVERDLSDCSDDEREYFASVAIEPERWLQTPWGDEGSGFWAVSLDADRVLWFNDIEEGFNVSRFSERGAIPEREYWCNQEPATLGARGTEDRKERQREEIRPADTVAGSAHSSSVQGVFVPSDATALNRYCVCGASDRAVLALVSSYPVDSLTSRKCGL